MILDQEEFFLEIAVSAHYHRDVAERGRAIYIRNVFRFVGSEAIGALRMRKDSSPNHLCRACVPRAAWSLHGKHSRGHDVRAVKRQGSVQRVGGVLKKAGLVASLAASAYLMALANGSTGCAWLGWFSLVPLFLVIRLWRPTIAMLAGAFWGASLYVFSVTQPEASVSPTVQSLCLLLLPAIPAIYAYLGAWLTRRIGFNPFVLGVAWMGLELALAPVGVRVGLVAATQGDGTFIHWVGGALGYVLVAFLVALVNASLVSLLSGARLSLPRERSFAGLPFLEGCPGSQTSCCVQLWALCEAQPRAPPLVPVTTAT